MLRWIFIIFSIIATLIHIPTNSMQGFTFLHSFASNGFCCFLYCFTWDKGLVYARPSFLSLPSVRMASVYHHGLPLILFNSHAGGLRWCHLVVWICIPTSFLHRMPTWLSPFIKLQASLLVSHLWIDSRQTLCLRLDTPGAHKLSLPLFHIFFQNCYFVIQMGRVLFLSPEQFA